MGGNFSFPKKFYVATRTWGWDKFRLAPKSQLGLTLEEMSNRRQSLSALCKAKPKDILALKIRTNRSEKLN